MATQAELVSQLESLFHRTWPAGDPEQFIDSALERTAQVLYAVIAETSSTWNQSAPTLPADYGSMRTV